MNYKTEQESFWAGSFGDSYISRNNDDGIVASNIALFSNIFKKIGPVSSVIEFGANVGLNLRAIRSMSPQAKLAAVEINSSAVDILQQNVDVQVFHQSILDFSPSQQWELALIKTVLIHINPEQLHCVYDLLYRSSSRYICIAEYYNPSPTQVMYRGNQDRLFKRDFAGEMLDRYENLRLIEYGFVYHRDTAYPLDDISWFLLEKSR